MAEFTETIRTSTPVPTTEQFNCVACDKPDSMCDMVQCDTCDRWWHQLCAGVTNSIEKVPWSCRDCIPAGSAPSIKSSRARQASLKLQQLDVQRALESQARKVKLQAKLDDIAADQQYVQDRYNLLRENNEDDDEEESVRSQGSHRGNRLRVENWLNQTQVPNVSAAKPGLTSGQPQPPMSSAITEQQPREVLTRIQQQGRSTGAYPKNSAGRNPSAFLNQNVQPWPDNQEWNSWSVMGVHQWESVLLQKGRLQMEGPKTKSFGIQQHSTGSANVGARSSQEHLGLEYQPSNQPNPVSRAAKSRPTFPSLVPLAPPLAAPIQLASQVDAGITTGTSGQIPTFTRSGCHSAPRITPATNPSDQFEPETPRRNPSHPSTNPGAPTDFGHRVPNQSSHQQRFAQQPWQPINNRQQPETSTVPLPPFRNHINEQGKTAPMYAPNENEMPAPEYDPLEPLMNQLGLEPNERPQYTPFINTYQPSQSQLAARQLMARDLPIFDGNPSDWPIFVSTFTNTTLACGYSPVENLNRLQRSLKGAALAAVRSKLMLPDAVPLIMKTLRAFYGRPESLINSLLEKIRVLPAPKPENLGSLADFGMEVQNLCDHIEAANQQAHMNNPSLLSELVEKLPAFAAYQWAVYSSGLASVSLREFGNFMSDLVKHVGKVTKYRGALVKEDKPRAKRGALHTHSETPTTSKEVAVPKKCSLCTQNHPLKDCPKFKSLDVDGRWHTVQREGICRNCLNYHGRRTCRSNSRCGIEGCTTRHHPLLHSNRSFQNKSSASTSNSRSNPTPTAPVQKAPVSGECLTHRSPENKFLFRILPITVHGAGKSIDTHAFVDEGSSLTLVEQSLVKELGAKGTPRVLCLTWTGKISRTDRESEVLDLTISGQNNMKVCLKDSRTVKNLSLSKQSLDFSHLSEQFPHLKGLPVASYTNITPRLLIGLNNLNLTVPLRIKEGQPGAPTAAKTRLGWCLYGGVAENSSLSMVNYHTCSCTADNSLHDLVRDYFRREDVGVSPAIQIESDADTRARRILQTTTSRCGDRFQTGLLWRFDEFELPDSRPMAYKRWECLQRRMNRQPQLRLNLELQIKNYIEKGYAHRATEEELIDSDPRRTWFLPLGAVINPKKPEKVRMIWDASATVDGISLNTMLLKGPDELNPLPWVLFRFRQFPVAISADIAEMFHQIRIIEKDRQAQRFLWNPDPQGQPEVYTMNVATFGSTCSPASAHYVMTLNAKQNEKQYPRAVEGIVKRTYVDDYADSFENEEEASRIAGEVKLIHAKGGFNIRGWMSNSSKVLESLGEAETSQPKSLNLENPRGYERILGMHWTSKEDSLGFSTILPPDINELLATGNRPTKRQLLRCLMSFFDPLGLLAAIILHGKILLQDVWRAGTQWDEPIDNNAFEKWLRWTKCFPKIAEISIPRCYFQEASRELYQDLELHIFVDASEEAYAAVAYFRVSTPEGFICSLVSAKTKVAPLKHWSIPRLELQAAVIGVRLRKFIVDGHSLNIRRTVFWSDSSTVLAWIRSDHRRYTQFVACRVGEILSNSEISEWRWVPSKLNIADHATKWFNEIEIQQDSAWFSGPEFLKESEENWPQPRSSTTTTEELKIPCLVHQLSETQTTVDFTRFSKWERVLRTTAYVNRYIALKTNRVKIFPEHLGQQELRDAENSLFGNAQWCSYPAEMSVAVHNRGKSTEQRNDLPKQSILRQMSPYLDENGVLRVDSRIGAAKRVSTCTKYPVILPQYHRLTDLIIDFYHRKYIHCNFETVVNELRQRFYIPRIRQTVKRVLRQCQWCKIYKSKPQVPRMAPLPEARLAAYTRPFSYTGLDLFGPILVKSGRQALKRWVALFTCLTIRAVHVEVVYSLSTESCIMSIRRFIGRRGAPIEIHSDNGTNFRGADNILQQQVRQFHENMAVTFTNVDTKWVFIPPGTPHMGGSWERLVRSVKTALEGSMIPGRKLDDEAFYTLLVDAEGIVNSRPLTYLPIESEEAEALTPNHFLLGSSNGVKQPESGPISEANGLRNAWSQINLQLDRFWSRWVREYLPTMTQRSKWFGETKPVRLGDLVVVVNEARRNGWARGRVLELVPGSDGRIRRAVVQTNKGLTRQSVAKLAVLEVAQGGNPGSNTSDTSVTGGGMLETGTPA
ncbi:uncharacterized protein LOC129753255 [Uranotaenia lowii]|uniref:uncharacterized protein LOC129753255 n=1 Tax=Uranotaenia lowii TaxID=190385 RepID=UPI002479B632|nr:uncharacterized protein LOC129753255 [Uranotaenia lowii]